MGRSTLLPSRLTAVLLAISSFSATSHASTTLITSRTFSTTPIAKRTAAPQSAPIQGLSNCPVAETTVTTSDGSVWAVCPNVDYQGPTTHSLHGVQSHDSCVKLCQQYDGCQKAVYDKTNFLCHIKSTTVTLTWAADTKYETIRQLSTLSPGTSIASCPYGAYNVSSGDGGVWSVCPSADYDGMTVKSIPNVNSEADCAKLCSSATACVRAVYETKNVICHLKDGTNSQWTANPKYESIALVSRHRAGDPITSCTTPDQNATSLRGTGFAICADSDYQGDSASVQSGVTSAYDCVNACDSATGCTKAVWDASSNNCILKTDANSPNPALTWVYSPGYQTVRLVNGSSSYTATRGKWAPVVNIPVVPAGAFIVPEQPVSTRILGFSSWGTFQFSGDTGMTQFADYNWQTGAVSQRTVTETKHDMFCPGMSFLADGRMIVTGGENDATVSSYDYRKNQWTRMADMNMGRGYQSSTILSDGRIFTIGGSFTGGIGGQDVDYKSGEVYDSVANTWTLLKGADVRPALTTFDGEGPWRTDNHAWLFAWKNGTVFHAGPSKTMHWYGTANGGSVTDAGVRDAANDTMCGVFVMYDAVAGKIFSAGGSQSYTNSAAFKRAHRITIDQPGQSAVVENLPDMNFQRGFANAVVLPNGQVVITGGQETSLVFTDIQSVMVPELWDPTTGAYTILAPATIPRNYHSVALLLADGTVLTGGGGMCPVGQGDSDAFCDKTVDHFNYEILSPPYLLNTDGSAATRPRITALASGTDKAGLKVRVGGVLTVTLDTTDAATFSLVRLSSATHSVNTDQRRVPLAQVVQSGAQSKVTLPADSGILPPGYYYLFAMNANGTPSIARTVQITL